MRHRQSDKREYLPGLEQLCRVLFAAALVLAPVSARGQSATTGAIAGVVRDTTGAVLPGVTVEAASPALIEKVRTVVTDAQGNYKVLDLRPGTYTVTFTLSGFSSYKREGIELTTGFTATANAEMKVGSLEETITVSGASPIVDTQNVRTQNVLSRQALDSLPTGKTIQAYSSLTLGAATPLAGQDVGGDKGELSTSISIHNNRGGDLKLLMDGMRVNTLQGSSGGGLRWFLMNQAAGQEVVLELSGISAESETGGIQVNVVPKEGGNAFKGYAGGAFANKSMQAGNLTDALRARGLLSDSQTVKKVYDGGAGVGGPIAHDRLWFFTSQRWWGSQNNAPGNYFNATQHSVLYTPDLSRPAYSDVYQHDHLVRLTWQATAKHKVTGTADLQYGCNCYFRVDSANWSPEASILLHYGPQSIIQSTWSHPATNRLLFDAGMTLMKNNLENPLAPGVSPNDIAVTELSTGYQYGSHGGAPGPGSNGTGFYSNHENGRASVSYISGSHALKTGLFFQTGHEEFPAPTINKDLSYSFRFGVPVSLTQWATPGHSDMRMKVNLGLYLQDQWTVSRLTLNLGLRFDYLNVYSPAQHRPGGQFVQPYDFPQVDSLPNWKDLGPRIGAAYDLFGTGKTAVKGALGRYVNGMGTGLANVATPAQAIVVSATRTWNDADGNLIPDCDLHALTANGECGSLSNTLFGTPVVNLRYADDYLNGFGVREYNWQASASVQHELRPGVGLNAGYFRTWYGNFTVIQNRAVTTADFDPFCIPVPIDTRLPGGGGNSLCGLYDVTPAKFGRVENIVRHASDFGKRTEVFNGVDIAFNAKFGDGGLLNGGVSVGRTVTDQCVIVDNPQQRDPGNPYCHVSPPWSAGTQVKFAAVYPLPGHFQASATFQNIPGLPIGGDPSGVLTGAMPAANYAVPNALIAPSLGRNLAAGAGAVALVDLLPPMTQFEDRVTQIDVRFTKILRLGRARAQGMFDIYNLLNASSVLALRTAYGPTWLRPTQTLGGRLFKVGAQIDF